MNVFIIENLSERSLRRSSDDPEGWEGQREVEICAAASSTSLQGYTRFISNFTSMKCILEEPRVEFMIAGAGGRRLFLGLEMLVSWEIFEVADITLY